MPCTNQGEPRFCRLALGPEALDHYSMQIQLSEVREPHLAVGLSEESAGRQRIVISIVLGQFLADEHDARKWSVQVLKSLRHYISDGLRRTVSRVLV